MLKRRFLIMLAVVMIISIFTGCGSASVKNNQTTKNDSAEKSSDIDSSSNAVTEAVQNNTDNENILIAYFSVPENVDTDGIDANSGASIVVKNKDVLGNMQYMAMTIQEAIGGELFRIETTEEYPLEHETLVNQAKEEQNEDARPELATHIENVEQYDIIFLGYPNWWGDMPQPLYTFLEEYDFSGKTIIPFNSHGGSGFSNTIEEIKKLQPNATVRDDGLSISRNDVADSEQEVADWANGFQ
ncbi:flavodoxin [Blautia sp. 1033sp1_1033st1_G9_1033SCRN_220408]|uniref:flavodoxin n=1 Tax=Blautia sp. 1033sp1_1033st1_G9_1033SCRN_220408 TaxID=3144490 RepID=UPI0034A4FCC5